jgi:predicted benzoate:H+ symporter BenE
LKALARLRRAMASNLAFAMLAVVLVALPAQALPSLPGPPVAGPPIVDLVLGRVMAAVCDAPWIPIYAPTPCEVAHDLLLVVGKHG